MSAEHYSDIPLEKKIKAERILLGAMLRDSCLMPQVIAGLNTAALSNASDGMGPVFLEIIAQFKDKGKYSVTSVSRKTGFKDLAYIAAEETETDLPMALDWWWTEYQQWAQRMALRMGLEGNHFDALAIREAVAKVEASLGLNWTAVKSNSKDDFLKWGHEKAEGKEMVILTRPPMAALRQIVPYFAPGDVWTISGETGMGKTAFAVNLLSHFINEKQKGIYFSLEMPGAAIYQRLLGVRHGINPKGDWRGLESIVKPAIQECYGLDFDMVDDLFNIAEIENAMMAKHYNGGINYAIIDLLDYVKTRDGDDDISRIFKVYTALVRISKRLKIPIIMLAHVNKSNKTAGGSRRPEIHHLKGSGTIGDASAGIGFLYRPEWHGIMEDANGQSTVGKAEFIVKKHRNGEVGTAFISWNKIRGYRDLEDFAPPEAPKATINAERIEPPF